MPAAGKRFSSGGRTIRYPASALQAGWLSRREAIALAGLVVCAAALRFWALGRQGFWYDEAVTASLVRETPAHMLADIPKSESTPPLYYVLAWGWARVFGQTEAGLRSLSAFVGVGAVPAMFLAARRLAGKRVAIVAAALICVNPLLVWYSQEARTYSLVVLEAAVCLLFFARARERPTLGRLLTWSVAGAISLCTHYFAIFVLAPQALLLTIQPRPSLRLRALSLVPLGLTGLALLTLAHTQSARIYWFTFISLPARAEQLPQQFLVGFGPPAGALVTLVAAGVVAAAAILLALRGGPRERRTALVMAAVAGAAFAVPVLLAAGGADYFNTRNSIAALPPLLIALAAGLGGERAGFPGLVAAAALVVVSIAMVVGVQGELSAQRGHYRELASILRTPSGRPRAMLLQGNRNWGTSLKFYLPRTRWLGAHGRDVTEIDVVRLLRHTVCPNSWWGAICEYPSLPALHQAPARGFRLVSSQKVAGFEVTRYRAARAVRVYPHQLQRDLANRSDELRGIRRQHVMITAPKTA
jgi:mannosyltransferase